MLRWFFIAVVAISTIILIPIFQPNSEGTLYKGTEGHPWWNDAVFYEIFVRSFFDSNGDGIGDLQGLIDKLDYLNDGNPETDTDLGIGALWLMPVMPSPSYHGYDVTDYYDTHPEYGSLDDFKQLINAAHERGIRIIIDLVLNHTSREHPWFQAALRGEQPYRDYYLWSEEDPGYASPIGGPAWHPSETGYYYAAFWGGMPDLNLENPKVIEEIESITRFWLKDVGVDGFRLDAIQHFVEEGKNQTNTEGTHRWLQNFYRMYKKIKPEAFTIGEAWTSTREIIPYVVDKAVDAAFEFETAGAMMVAARTENNGPIRIAHAVDQKSYPSQQFAMFLTNHDQNRLMSELGGDVGRAKVAASLLLTSPGIPFLYYGEEVGMTGVKPDEDIRLPMQWEAAATAGFTSGTPWRAPNENIEQANVAVQKNNPDSLFNHYRKLIHLRNHHDAMRIGDWVKVRSSHRSVYAYIRQSREETLLVVVNLSGHALSDYDLRLLPNDGTLSGANFEDMFEGIPITPPTLDEDGVFDDYKPVETLAPHQLLVIKIN